MRHIFLTTLVILMALPLMAKEVNVYSYRQPDLIAPLTQAFEEETGIKVNVAYLDSGMIERLKAEGKRSPADVILTVDIARLAEIVKQDLTQAVSLEALGDNVPALYRDPKAHWFGVTTRARIVYASKTRVNPSEIPTYESLADPKWRGRVCMRSGTHPYNIALVAAMLHHHGQEATRDWLVALKSNLARRPQGNDRAQVKAIWSGECDISIGNTYYMGAMLQDPDQKPWAEAVNVVFPRFEKGGTHVNISGVAMTKHAPHRENALQLMAFLTSPRAQEIYATANFEYPVAPDAKPDPLVASWGAFEADGVNLMEIAPLRPAALRLIEEVDFDG